MQQAGVNHLASIQVLRALAATLVMTLHGCKLFVINGYPLGDWFFGRGDIGVDLFFVISGFVMVHTTRHLTRRPSVEAQRFLLRRAIKIIPLYYLLTLVFITIEGGWSHYFVKGNYEEVFRAFLFIPDELKPPVWLGWTLNFEFFFYLIFAASMFWGRYRVQLVALLFAIQVIMLPLLAGQTPSMETTPHYFAEPYLDMMASPMLWHFAAGMLIALYYPKMNMLANWSLIILVFAALLFIVNYSLIPEHVLGNMLASAILLFGILQAEVNGLIRKWPSWILKLGDASYSIYLLHWFTLLYFPPMFAHLGLNFMAKGWGVALFFYLVTPILAYQMWRWFERPVSDILRKKLIR